MTSTLLFDLDGTLTDPFEGISRCLRHALERMRIPLAESFDWGSIIGPPFSESMPLMGIPHERIDEAIVLYRERFSVLGMYENELYGGIVDVLERASAKYRLFVCTSKPRVFAEKIVKHFGIAKYFDGVYGCEFDGTRGHKAELMGYLLDRESLDPSRTVMIGDRRHDVAAALAHNLTAYGAAWGYGTRAELEAAGAHAIYESPAELRAALA